MSIRDLNPAEVGKLDPNAAVVMLNLMRFRARSADGDGTGWDAYLRYSRMVSPLIKAAGGSIIWAGKANAVPVGDIHVNQWHYVALVRYPSAAFNAMMTSDAYATGNLHRENGCAEHVIVALTETFSRLHRA